MFVVWVGVIYVLLFLGWLDDIGDDGLVLICDIVDIFEIYGILIEIILVSVWYLIYVIECVKVGVDIVMVLFKVFE